MSTAATAVPMSPQRRFWLTVAVMSASIMQVLDTTILNVALPNMAGELSATPDQISWVLTSYLIAAGIFMTMTGYFADRFGQKTYMMASIFGFALTSALCGLSTNLASIVGFRLLQGVFGAALVPLSQSIMLKAWPLELRGKAMAIWGMGVMAGPILGPTLGGWLTETFNWRWTFFINVPVGVVSLLIASRMVPESERVRRPMDWYGLAMLFLAIGGLQFVLDRGNEEDWFSSHSIQAVSLISLGGFLGLLHHGLTHEGPQLIRLSIFRDRNFATASALLAVFGLGLYGTMLLQPLMMERLMHYTTMQSGLVMAPRGIASMLSMMIAGRLVNRIGSRWIIVTGIILSALGSWGTTWYNLDMGTWWLVWPVMIQGAGLGLIVVPLATVAYATLDPLFTAEAAGLYSLLRTLGSAVGISVASNVFSRHIQSSWQHLVTHVNPYNTELYRFLDHAGLSETPTDPASVLVLASEVARQAEMLGILDAFSMIAWSFVCMLPLVLLLQEKPAAAAAAT